MHKVEIMTQAPTNCLTCGRGNTVDDPHTMEDFFAIDLERDVNWGDPTYICRYCCDTLAALAGFVTEDQLREQMNLNQRLKERLHDTEAQLEEKKRRLNRISRGRRALKDEQDEAAPDRSARPEMPARSAAKRKRTQKAETA